MYSKPAASTPAPNVLTTEKAQNAINQFMSNKGGSLRIRGGVREVPSENSAVAELDIDNFTADNKIYSGDRWNGKAIFSKYSDGRWSLTKIHLTNPGSYAWQAWDMTIEVH